jgi:chromosomal replication initiator protein
MKNIPEDLWTRVLERLRTKIPENSYNAWFSGSRLLSVKDGKVWVRVKGYIHAELIEKNYKSLIVKELAEAARQPLDVAFTDSDDLPAPAAAPYGAPAVPDPEKPPYSSRKLLNPDYTFEKYVTGPSNEFAQSAAQAVAEAPGLTKFNPLLVYGGSGLGKTHLLCAIGTYVAGHFPNQRISYVSSDQFGNDFVNSIKNNTATELSNKYRNFDLLLMDDIQFFKGKVETQEFFFHIFNTLHHNQKQIVFTCDKHPKDLEGLEERLVSRFQSGLSVDIQPPSVETRLAILYKKAEEKNLSIPDEVLEYIAHLITTNIRELEGSIIRLLFHSSMTGKPVTLDLAKELLKLEDVNSKVKIYTEVVIEKVAEYYKISTDKMVKRSREKEVVGPRQMAMFLARKMTNDTLEKIGRVFDKDHSTVIHACKNIEKLIKTDQYTSNDYERLRTILLKTPG